MILSGREIARHMGREIVIEPFDPKRLNPNSYNLSLHNELLALHQPCLGHEGPKPGGKAFDPPGGAGAGAQPALPGAHQRVTKTDCFVPCWRVGPP